MLQCKYFTSCHITLEQSRRTVADYELDFNITGGRVMTVDNRAYKIGDNSIVFRRPGEKVQSEGVYDMYMMTFCFDLSSHAKNYQRGPAIAHASHAKPDIQLLSLLPSYIVPTHPEEMKQIYQSLISAFERADSDTLCSRLVTKLLFLLAADCADISPPTQSDDKISRAIAYISEHYNEALTLDGIARKVYLDKSYLTRCFKKAVGTTPIDYLIKTRISNAKVMLSETTSSVSEIAFLCGFSDVSYFIMRFRESEGMTPAKYRENILRDLQSKP